MNKLLIALFAGLLSTQAIGAVSDVDRALVEKGRNVFRNGGAENGKADWSASGGTLTAVSGSKASGQLGISWDSSAAAQTLVLSSVSNIPDGLKGRNGAAVCKVRVPSGTATHTFTVDDGTNNLATAQTIPSQTTFQLAIVNFVYPNSAVPLRFKFTSVAANEPAIDVDECVGTDAFNILQVSQAIAFGSAKWPATANCEWSQSGAGTFTADTDCTNPSGSNLSGNASAPATKVPGIRFANGLPPGEYLVMAIGFFYCNNASNNCVSAMSLSDGTNRTSIQKILGSATGTTTFAAGVSVISGRFNYATAQGDTTIQLYSEAVAAGNQFVNANTSSTVSDLQFIVYRFPSSSEIAYRPELNAAYYSGYHDSTCVWSRTNTAYGDFTADATCNLVTRVSSGISAAATGSVLPALALTLPKLGTYYVCGNITFAGGAAADHSVRLWDGTTVISEATETGGNPTTIPLCGIYNATTLTPTLTIQGKSTSGSVVAQPQDAGTTVKWTIFPITGNFPAPVLVGSVTSAATGAMRVEGATLAAPSAGSCVVTESGSSDWINGNASSAGTGRCAVTFNSGIFSSAPSCTCTSVNGTRICSWFSGLPTSTGFEYQVNTSVSGAAEGDPVSVICIGPR